MCFSDDDLWLRWYFKHSFRTEREKDLKWELVKALSIHLALGRTFFALSIVLGTAHVSSVFFREYIRNRIELKY